MSSSRPPWAALLACVCLAQTLDARRLSSLLVSSRTPARAVIVRGVSPTRSAIRPRSARPADPGPEACRHRHRRTRRLLRDPLAPSRAVSSCSPLPALSTRHRPGLLRRPTDEVTQNIVLQSGSVHEDVTVTATGLPTPIAAVQLGGHADPRRPTWPRKLALSTPCASRPAWTSSRPGRPVASPRSSCAAATRPRTRS